MTLDDLVDVFELLGDWEQRYNYLIELGDKLPEMPRHLMVKKNNVKGCMSIVYVCAYHDENKPLHFHYYGYCDTSIIRGVLAVLINLVEDKTAEVIENMDIDELFRRLQLDEHLSPNRHVGIYAIVALMKQQVQEISTVS
ncbi:MAG: SufE family protein [Gammaproteobacteria bacterium]|nr:SufE family protein [Gammaproteobacteria bacterium]